MSTRTNLVFIGIDSLRKDHMSLYGYDRLTTPHIEKFAAGGTVFENAFSPHVPTTSGYGAMLTGMDCFSTSLVALRHDGDMAKGVTTLPEILRKEGYATSCVGFTGNVAARGFDNYLDYSGWGMRDDGRSPKGECLNASAIPELKRLAAGKKPFFLFMRHMDPHSPHPAGSDEQYKLLYRRHRWRVEGVHGEAKTQHGLGRATRRGLTNVAIQVYLTAAVMNLKRLAKAFWAPFLRFLLLWRSSYNCLGRIVHLLRHLCPGIPRFTMTQRCMT